MPEWFGVHVAGTAPHFDTINELFFYVVAPLQAAEL